MKNFGFWLILSLMAVPAASAQGLPRGQVIDNVECLADAAQRYSLYLPSNFTPSRQWPVIFGFDAGGRGRTAVERYQEAAEKYGYIVAGSNNARNGPWNIILYAAAAMTADVSARFPLDTKRLYTAGMSGGARAAMLLALHSEAIAGVFASSAGFPEGFQESVRFPVFGTAGTDDFNHYEMYRMDRDLKSPHRIEVFPGTHEWLPAEVAMNGVEWMEIQAMKSGLRSRDPKLIDDIFAKRMARAEAQKSELERMRELQSIALDFRPFKDVARVSERAAALERRQDVKDAVAAEEVGVEREAQLTAALFGLRDRLETTTPRTFADLEQRVNALIDSAAAMEDSSDRRIARRVLAQLSASTASRDITHPQFRDLLSQIRRAVPLGPR